MQSIMPLSLIKIIDDADKTTPKGSHLKKLSGYNLAPLMIVCDFLGELKPKPK